MTVVLLVVLSALTGLAALAGAAACLSAQRGLSLRAESVPIDVARQVVNEEEEPTNEL